MFSVDDKPETIHLNVVREEEKRPHTAFPLFCSLLCLLGIVALTIYSAQHPYYEHARLTVPAQLLPLKVFKAETPIIPTGVKTYPATYAHGFLTFSNGSVIGQSIPSGFTIDDAATDSAIYVPPATANGFGMATIGALLLTACINLKVLAINEVIGSSLFIRNLSPFVGGHAAYSITYQRPIDRIHALATARSLVAALQARVGAFLVTPCSESIEVSQSLLRLTWRCQFATFKVPSYMRVSAAHLRGTQFIVDVVFVPRPVLTRFR